MENHLTPPTRAELEELHFIDLLHQYAGLIEDTTILQLPYSELAPHGHPNTRGTLIDAICRHHRIK